MNIPHKFICGDFNIHHPTISLPTHINYSNEDAKQYQSLEEILLKYNMSIINDFEQPTFQTTRNDKPISSILVVGDLTNYINRL